MLISNAQRIDIISDTHGYLSSELIKELQGADLIVHAGDIVHTQDLEELKGIAPVHAVLGNNDFFGKFPPEVEQNERFTYGGFSFYVTHIKSAFVHPKTDVIIYGHTHRPYINKSTKGYEINPGSPTFPRSEMGSTMARLWIDKGEICSAELITL